MMLLAETRRASGSGERAADKADPGANAFATAPMPLISITMAGPATTGGALSTEHFQQTTTACTGAAHADDAEEALHSAFEEAISQRLLAFHLRQSRISGPLALSSTSTFGARARPCVHRQTGLSAWLPRRWRPWLMRLCLALALILIGFDLMGLLVLCTR